MKAKIKAKFKKLALPFEKYFPPVRLGVILLGIISVILLFVPPITGAVDDGSYNLIIHANGLREYPNDLNYFKYFVPKFLILQYYNPYKYAYLSLQNILIQIAILLNKIFYSTKVFDIRFLGVIYTILFLLAARLLFKGLSRNLKGGKAYLIVLLGVFFFGDTTYITYFNSFYVEPLEMIMIMFFVGFGLMAFQQTENKAILKYYGGQLLVAFLFIFVSKELAFIMSALCISLIGGLLFIRSHQWKIAAMIIVGSLVPISLFTETLYSNPQHNENAYQSMTLGAMPAFKDTEKNLAQTDIDPQTEILEGTPYAATYVIAPSNSKTITKGFIDELSYGKLSWYYLTHPSIFSKLLQMGLENENIAYTKNISNYEKGVSEASKRVKPSFRWATIIKGAFLPKKFGFYLILTILVLALYGISCVRGLQMGSKLYEARFFMNVGLILMMLMSFIAPLIISGETSASRKLIMASILTNIILLIIVSDTLQHDIWITKDTVLLTKIEEQSKNEK